jgi:hypothetical protein
MPRDFQQFVLLNGFTGDIWMPPGVTLEQVREGAGLGAKRIGENGASASFSGRATSPPSVRSTCSTSWSPSTARASSS